MSRFPALAVCDAGQLAPQALARRLRALGVVVRLEPFPVQPCLSFQLFRGDEAAVCHVPASAWAEHHLPDLAGLDWAGMTPAVVAGLTGVERPLHLCHAALQYDRALPSAAPGPHAGQLLPVVTGEEGPVWIERVGWRLPATRAHLRGDIALYVDLQLGAVRLSTRQLRRLRRGDIVQLPMPVPRAYCAAHPLFDFHLHPDSITVSDLALSDDTTPSPHSLHADDDAPCVRDLADLPLTLQVQLGELSLSVAELSTLTAGSVLPLPADAYRRLQLRYGGQRVATGELVQIGDALGVQLTQVPGLT